MLGLTMRKNGDQFRSACPACKSGGDRALAVNIAKNSFFCFALRKGGDVISFAAHIRNESPREAALFLSGGGISSAPSLPAPQKLSPTAQAPPEKRELQPLTYLEATHNAVQALGVSPETALAWGAGYAPKGIMRGRFAIPIHSKDGALLAYVGVAVQAEQSPRLLFPNGFQPESVIFGCNRVEAGELNLVRDPLQVLTAFEAGVTNVVSFLAPINAQMLEQLASLCDEKRIDTVELF
jgi:hypothetical protein